MKEHPAQRRRAGRLAAAAGAVLAVGFQAGCVEPPMSNTAVRRYGPPVSYAQPQSPRPAPQTVKTVSPSAQAVPEARSFPKTASASSSGGAAGNLDDVVSRIRARKAEKAKEAEAKARQERDKWLDDRAGDFSDVRTRLKTMRVFAATTQDAAAKAAVRKAVSETESDIDALRGRIGDRPVGFSDAAAIRTALQARHEKLLSSHGEYRRIAEP